MRLPRQLEDLAKHLTYILCHRPDEFGLVLDPDGFVAIKQLLQALSAEPGWGHVRRHHLEQLAGLMSPPGFEIVGERLRGISPGPARLRRPGEPPPALLYGAIPPKAHERVFEAGLRAHLHQELLLADNPDRALKLGRRRSPAPLLVTVQAERAARAGVAFQGYGEGLYLALDVPREFLQLAPPPQKREKPKPEKAPPPPGPSPVPCSWTSPNFWNLQAGPRAKARRASPPGSPAPGPCAGSAGNLPNESCNYYCCAS